MMFSLEMFHRQYETDLIDIKIDRRSFHVLLPKDLSRFVDFQDALDEFPLWAKVWKASWILAGYLAALPLEEDKQYLEIGGGLGFVSIVAASSGHRITMTDCNPDALQFARANAYLNHCRDLTITELDWNQPRLKGIFDYIVASEITYKEDSFPQLLSLFNAYLKKEGEIIIASEIRRTTEKFCHHVQSDFSIQVQKKKLLCDNESLPVILLRLTRK
jgi:predicted nicotinamide N-methyase